MSTSQQIFSMLILAMWAVLLPAAATKYDPRASIYRTYFGCSPCEPSRCPATPPGCELVKEPGICGCCQTCALQKGDPCGILTNRCGQGLKCTPPPFSDSPMEALFKGEGACVKERVSPLSLFENNNNINNNYNNNNEIKRHLEMRKRKVSTLW